MWPQSRYRGRQRVYLHAMRSPHLYTKIVCTAKRNFDHECKKTFATKSAHRVVSLRCGSWSLSGQSGHGVSRTAEAVLLEANSRLVPAASIGACAGHSTGLRLLRLLEILAGNRMPRV